MGTIALTDATPQTPIVSSLVNNNNAALEAVLNGGVDEANLEAAKIITPSTHIKQEGATANQTLYWNGSAWTPGTISAFFTTPGTLLGIVEYDPTVVVTATTASTTGVDIDATNLSLAVTVPSSGKIMVGFSIPPDLGGTTLFLGLRESTTDIGYRKCVASGSFGLGRATMYMYVSGISAGAHTYKAAMKVVSGTSGVAYGTQSTPAAGNPGPAQMAIWAVA